MDASTYWLLTRYVEGDGKIFKNTLFDKLTSENLVKGSTSTDSVDSNVQHGTSRTIGRLVKRLFPSIRLSSTSTFVMCDLINTERRTSTGLYQGLIEQTNFTQNVADPCICYQWLLINGWCVTDQNNIFQHLNQTECTLIIDETSSYSVKIGETQIDMAQWGFPSGISIKILYALTKFLDQIKICRGVQRGGLRGHLSPLTSCTAPVDGIQRIQDVRCLRVVPLLSSTDSCTRCQQSVKQMNTNEKRRKARASTSKKCVEPKSTGNKVDELKSLLFEIAPSMEKETVDILCNITQNTSKSPTRRRWNCEVLRFALNLWSLSPKAYEDICDRFTLPSVRLLQSYKNVVNQSAGLNSDMLDWMTQTADRKGVPQAGRRGGLIFDEMSIQQDLQLDFTDGKPSLVGAVDLGEQCRRLEIIRQGKVVHPLATHVLQYMFLGHSGFVFPFCHYPTKGVQAYHLYPLFWKSVRSLLEYGFQIDYSLFDGASANRTFLKNMFHPDDPITRKMTVPNLEVPGEYIVLGMDSKHVIKRLRNNVLTSGQGDNAKGEKFSRSLKYGEHFIEWDHWCQAFKWDVNCNPEMTRLHHKLTKEHIEVDGAAKMRNHLAEDCLNSDMLNLMEKFADSQGNPDYLNSTLEFLRQTSKLVTFVHDDRMVTESSDQRLKVLGEVKQWFAQWEDQVLGKSDLSNKEKKSQVMTAETREDIQYCCVSLEQIILNRLASGSSALPSRINSDVVENFFCQQRCRNNGANSNPTYLQYAKGATTIIMSSRGKNRARKSNAGLNGAVPYNFFKHEPGVKRRKVCSQDKTS